jgi:hypothetical protein
MAFALAMMMFSLAGIPPLAGFWAKFYVFLAAGVLALVHKKGAAFALAGAALALAALARPSYLYLLYVVSCLLLVTTILRRDLFGLNLRHAVLFVAAASLILAPWTARNLAVFGDPSITAGYGGFILVQRVAYNAMSWSEWAVAFVYWLPDFGDSLAKALFPVELYRRLEFSDPSSFYAIGNNALMSETLEAAGGRDAHLPYLLKKYVLGDLFTHIIVTVPITLRGIWAGKYLALAGVVMMFPVARHLMHKRRLLPFGFLVFSCFFMAGLHGFVSVNVVRYNIPMLALYASVVGIVVVEMTLRWSGTAAGGQQGHGHPANTSKIGGHPH